MNGSLKFCLDQSGRNQMHQSWRPARSLLSLYIYTFPLVAIYVKNLREVTPGYPRVYIRFVLVQPNKSNNPDLNRSTFFTLSANLTWLRFFLNPEGLANPTWSINWFHLGLIRRSLGWTPILIHRTNWYWTKKSSQPDQVILKIGSNNASLFSSINFLVKTVFLTWKKMQINLLNPIIDIHCKYIGHRNYICRESLIIVRS